MAAAEREFVYEPDRWLDEDQNLALERICRAVVSEEKFNASTYADLAFFTPHGADHSKMLIRRLHELIPDKYLDRLKPHEPFYLLAAAWLHDLGMLTSVHLDIHGVIPDKFSIRKVHHTTSRDYVAKNWERISVKEADKNALGLLCQYHRRCENIADCPPTYCTDAGDTRTQLLAAYLRLADALDMTISRTPADSWAALVAYEMPEDSRLHWIKSRVVDTVRISPSTHDIAVLFRSQGNAPSDLKLADHEMKTLKSIRSLVLDDLEEELASISDVLTDGGVTHYVHVKPKDQPGGIDAQLRNDIRELLTGYDTMTAPSASKLLEMILIGTGSILGYSLNRRDEPQQFKNYEQNRDLVMKRLEGFVHTIKENILTDRPCHLGLVRLAETCDEYRLSVQNGTPLNEVVSRVNQRFRSHHDARDRVRLSASTFFQARLPLLEQRRPLNLLLYGYSELVTKALCGIRDAVIARDNNGLAGKSVKGMAEELAASDLIRIYVCDGQAKTHTGHHDRIIYHDGSQYALHLRRHGFTRITLIPDVNAATVIAKLPIDYVLVGANGISETVFMHSAGHYTIVQAAKCHPETTKTILVLTEEKVGTDPLPRHPCKSTSDSDSEIIEGCTFAQCEETGANRENIWMCRDEQLLATLRSEGVRFLNPRQDEIPVAMVDWAISERGWTSGPKAATGEWQSA